MLLSWYCVSAEGNFHFFTKPCIKNGKKEILNWIELNNTIYHQQQQLPLDCRTHVTNYNTVTRHLSLLKTNLFLHRKEVGMHSPSANGRRRDKAISQSNYALYNNLWPNLLHACSLEHGNRGDSFLILFFFSSQYMATSHRISTWHLTNLKSKQKNSA
jgi:hypothetical protein